MIDATDSEQLLALGERRFDAAVCTMAIMDMASIEPLVSSLSRLLKAGGRFVFSVMHPCFNSASTRMVAEQQEDRDGVMVTEYSVKVSEYIRPSSKKGQAMVGQPAVQYYFEPTHKRAVQRLLWRGLRARRYCGACFRSAYGWQHPDFVGQPHKRSPCACGPYALDGKLTMIEKRTGRQTMTLRYTDAEVSDARIMMVFRARFIIIH